MVSVLALQSGITPVEHLHGFSICFANFFDSTTWLLYDGLEPRTPVTEDITRGDSGRIHSCW